MNKHFQILSLIITLFISGLSVLFVYDTFSRFNFSFVVVINNLFITPVIHALYVLLILVLSFPALRFNLLLLQEKSNLKNRDTINEILDSSQIAAAKERTLKKAWRWHYLFSILFLLHPLMFLLVSIDKNITITNPLGFIIISLINMFLGLYLVINSRKMKEMVLAREKQKHVNDQPFR